MILIHTNNTAYKLSDYRFFSLSKKLNLLYKFYTTSSSLDGKPTGEFLQKVLSLPFVPSFIFSYSEAFDPINRAHLKLTSGIYIWYNTITGMCYIGSAIDLNNRVLFHVRKSGPKNVNFKKAWELNGPQAFVLLIVELGAPTPEVCKSTLLAREQFYLDTVPTELKYNISTSATGPRGKIVRTKEFREQLSIENSGAGNPNYNNIMTAETLAKQRLAKKAFFVSFYATNLITGEVIFYDSIASCVAATGASRMQISRAVHGRYNSHELKINGVPKFLLTKVIPTSATEV